MDERVTKCLDTIREAFKTLIASANSECEIIGLVLAVLGELEKTNEKAIDEGVDELKKREKEGN
jgi:hypothetical protein